MSYRIGLDIDGCIYKWDATARFLLEEIRGCEEIGESQSWDHIEKRVSKEDWKWLWSKGVSEYGLFRHGHVYKGAIEGVKRLAEYGDIVVITNRPKSAAQDTLDWLSYHKFPVTEVHIMPGQPKSSVLPECDFYIDDSLDNVKELCDNTEGTVLLWQRPWNVYGREPTDIYLCIGDWNDAIRIIEREREVVPV